MALKILINGGKGRMGHAVADAAKAMGITVVGSVDVGDRLNRRMCRRRWWPKALGAQCE